MIRLTAVMLFLLSFLLDDAEQNVVVVLTAPRRVDGCIDSFETVVPGKPCLDPPGGIHTGGVAVEVEYDTGDLRVALKE